MSVPTDEELLAFDSSWIFGGATVLKLLKEVRDRTRAETLKEALKIALEYGPSNANPENALRVIIVRLRRIAEEANEH